MLHIFSRRQEKNTYVKASGIEVGLRFLLEGFPGQKQSWGAQLNVFIVLLVLKRAPKWVFFCFSLQAEPGSLHHNHSFNIMMTQSCRPPPAVMCSQSKRVDTGQPKKRFYAFLCCRLSHQPLSLSLHLLMVAGKLDRTLQVRVEPNRFGECRSGVIAEAL